MRITNRTKKIITILLIIILFIPVLTFTGVGNIFTENSNASSELSNDDRAIAEQISDMTGIDVEEVLSLKEKGESWNEILESLRNKNSDSMDLSDSVLNETNYEKLLKDEGYSEEKINNTKMIIDRIKYDFDEINYYTEGINPLNDMEGYITQTIDNQSDLKDQEKEIEICKDIAEKLDEKFLLYAAIKLENQYGSIEEVIDEYLYSLQIDVDFQLALNDSATYEKEKSENSLGVNQQEIITIRRIESLLILIIQDSNNKEESVSSTENNTSTFTMPDIDTSNSISTVEVSNPTIEIQQELEQLNPNLNNN